jgi:hypothetical protein
MRTRLCTDKPDEITFSLTVVATAKEFEQLRDQLANITAHPTSEFRYALNDVLAQARKIYWARDAS